VARKKPYYPTRAELAEGAKPPPAVPPSFILKLLTGRSGHRLDRWLVSWTGFSVISWQAARDRGIAYQRSLLLTTTGRKTSLKRSVVLPYVTFEEGLVVVASNGGGPRNPSWLENLRANPGCEVIVSRRKRSAVAAIPQGNERIRLLDKVAITRPQVHNYEYHAGRHGRTLELAVLK